MTGGCTPIALYAVSFSNKEGRFVSKYDPVTAFRCQARVP